MLTHPSSIHDTLAQACAAGKTLSPHGLTIALVSDVHLEVGGFFPEPVAADLIVAAGDVVPFLWRPDDRFLESALAAAAPWPAFGEKLAAAMDGKKRLPVVSPVSWLRAWAPDTPSLFVPGNHDFYGGLPENVVSMLKEEAVGSQVYVLDNNKVRLFGVDFLGTPLWSDLLSYGRPARAELMGQLARAVSDFSCIKGRGGNWSVGDMLQANEASVAFLERELEGRGTDDSPVVAVTHWPPSLQSGSTRFFEDRLSPYFLNHLPHLVGKASLWLHGHTHSRADYASCGSVQAIQRAFFMHRLAVQGGLVDASEASPFRAPDPPPCSGRVINHPRGYLGYEKGAASYSPARLLLKPDGAVVRL